MKRDAILVTGGTQRLGLALTQHFSSKNIQMIATWRTQKPAVDKLRCSGVDVVQCDFNSMQDVRDLVAYITDSYESLKAIVHNAGVWSVDDFSSAESADRLMQNLMRVHVTVPQILNNELHMLLSRSQSETADIIHIGDYVSSRGSVKHIGYAASKAAQDSLTLSFAQKYAPKIKVNTIAPALIEFNDTDSAEYKNRSVKKSLMERHGGSDELIALVEYLMGSNYITGRVLPLDGGRHLKSA
ncbi:MAG: dihydromonapterin reductase [Pseudomonadota bacterium]